MINICAMSISKNGQGLTLVKSKYKKNYRICMETK